MNLMFQPLKKYADFKGRARRSEYWLFYLGFVIALCVALAVDSIIFGGPGLLYAIVALGAFVPSLAVGFRRLHDTERSAWWLLIALIPFIGAVVLLVFLVLPGTPGANRFGPDPKAADPLTDPIVA